MSQDVNAVQIRQNSNLENSINFYIILPIWHAHNRYMKTKNIDSENSEIVSIRKASSMLGVSEATLRQWTDEGKLQVFITPGGHRRYSKTDLRRFTKSSRRVIGLKDLASKMEDTTKLHRDIGRVSLANLPDQSRLDPQKSRHLAHLGRILLDLMIKCISDPSKRESIIVSAKAIGTDFGKTLAEMGFPLTASVEAFISHRDPLIKAATHLIGKGDFVKSNVVESIPVANNFIDEALLSMIASHQHNSVIVQDEKK